MDRLRAFAESDRDPCLPLPREALRDLKSNRYVLYDGGSLPASHAEDAADRQLAADATARCRRKDVGQGHFNRCHSLSMNGANDVPAILQVPGTRRPARSRRNTRSRSTRRTACAAACCS